MTIATVRAAAALLLSLATGLAHAADDAWKIVAYINPELPFNAREVPLHPAPGGLALTVVGGLWNLVPATLAAKVTDTDGTRRQKFADIEQRPAGVAPDDWAHGDALLWAGDLDRDGKLDVITALTGDDGATMCVWLSSKAAAGELVGKAACMNRAY